MHKAVQKHEIRDNICPRELTGCVNETENDTAVKGRCLIEHGRVLQAGCLNATH